MLRDLREKQGLSQQEMANLLGIERSRLSEIERGRPSKWLLSAIRLNRFLEQAGYTLDDLILFLPDPEEPETQT